MEAVIKMLEDKLRADMRAYNLYKPQQEIMLPTFEVWAGYSRREMKSCITLLKVIKSDTFLFSGIITPIVNELRSAEKKHPKFPTNLFEQVCILQEEAGEVSKAANDIAFNRRKGGFARKEVDELVTELRQTAAMCLRILQTIDSNGVQL